MRTPAAATAAASARLIIYHSAHADEEEDDAEDDEGPGERADAAQPTANAPDEAADPATEVVDHLPDRRQANALHTGAAIGSCLAALQECSVPFL